MYTWPLTDKNRFVILMPKNDTAFRLLNLRKSFPIIASNGPFCEGQAERRKEVARLTEKGLYYKNKT